MKLPPTEGGIEQASAPNRWKMDEPCAEVIQFIHAILGICVFRCIPLPPPPQIFVLLKIRYISSAKYRKRRAYGQNIPE
jgi:hypothetical protein